MERMPDESTTMARPCEEDDSMAQLPNSLEGPASFTKFGDLPTEIRFMVWREAVMTARLVIFEPLPTTSALQSGHLPPLLYVNSESRRVASEHYTLRFTIEFRLTMGYHPRRKTEFKEYRRRIILSPHDVLAFYGIYKIRSWNDRFVFITGVKAADGWSSDIKRVALLGKNMWERYQHQLVPFLTSGSVDLEAGLAMNARERALLPAHSHRLTLRELWLDADHGELDYKAEVYVETRLKEAQRVIKSAFVICEGDFQCWADLFLGTPAMWKCNSATWHKDNPYHIYAFELTD